MQFSTLVSLAAVIVSTNAAALLTQTVESSTVVTITSCGPEHTNCPASSPATPAPAPSA
ncbi:hypothetical protein MGI_04222, partial [Candida albicans P75016]